MNKLNTNDDKVYIKELFLLLFKYKYKMFFICVLAVGFSLQLTNLIPRKYKSTFEINVYSKYFKSPLISEIIPGVYNIPEMRFTIDSMVKEAISDDYIDEIGSKYNLYKEELSEREFARQRQFLKDRFAFFSTGGQSYQVSFIADDPHMAKDVAESTLALIKNHIIQKRIATIELVKQIMVKKLNSFNAAQKISQKGSDKVLASKSPDVLKSELLKINANISALSKQYNSSHPKIKNLLERRRTIKGWLKEFKNYGIEAASEVPVAITQNKEIAAQIASKFYTKYHDFNIALEIEKKSLESYIGVIKRPQLPTSPISPKKRLFASVGMIFGLILSFLFVFIKEITAPNKDEQLTATAIELNTTVLGVMPKVTKKKKKEILHTIELIEENRV